MKKKEFALAGILNLSLLPPYTVHSVMVSIIFQVEWYAALLNPPPVSPGFLNDIPWSLSPNHPGFTGEFCGQQSQAHIFSLRHSEPTWRDRVPMMSCDQTAEVKVVLVLQGSGHKGFSVLVLGLKALIYLPSSCLLFCVISQHWERHAWSTNT